MYCRVWTSGILNGMQRDAKKNSDIEFSNLEIIIGNFGFGQLYCLFFFLLAKLNWEDFNSQ
jgi:hypothetical protein